MSDSDLVGKADALMKRHRAFIAAGAQATPPPSDEDLPILTDVVNVVNTPAFLAPALDAVLSGGPGAEALTERMRELLAPLPPDIAHALERWLAATLPRLVARQLDGVAEQIAVEVGAALRDSLPLLIADLVHAAAARAKPQR